MKSTLILLLIIFPTYLFAGGPWLIPKKAGFFQLQTTLPISSFNRLFLENNQELNLNRSVLDYTFQAYMEYGITDKLNLISALPYKYISTGNEVENIINTNLLPQGNLNGIGNFKLALKYRLSDKDLKASASIQSSLKTIAKKIENGLITGYDANSLGLYIAIGKSFSANLYSYFEAGINTYSNNFSTILDIHYELGYQLKPSLWIILTIDMRESLKNGSFQNENLRQTGFYTNDQEYLSPGIKVNYELKNNIGFALATYAGLSGNYVGKVGMFSLGVYKKW